MKLPVATLAIGIALALLGWAATRAAARCRSLKLAPLLLDLLVPAAGFAFLLLGTGKPLFAGAVIATLGGSFALADRLKRRTLDEPIVGADLFTALDIFRNPRICVLFPDAKILTAITVGMVAVIGLFALLFQLEPPRFAPEPLGAAALAATLCGLAWLAGKPGLAAAGRALRKLEPGGDPIEDSARYGALATMLMHGLLARAERGALRRAATRSAANLDLAALPGGPIVVVQCESFFDARRLHRSVSPRLLAGFERHCRESLQWGRLQVPSIGANSVRTEFAVLTGLPERAIGLDRFNPYQGFARAPIASLASKLHAAGYRTLCLHPFDRRFYGRDRVMTQLGFDQFVALEGFEGAEKVGLFTADLAVAQRIAEAVRSLGPKIFVFAITMENHGPWQNRALHGNPARGLPSLPRQQDLMAFLQSVGHADAMLAVISAALRESPAPGLLGFYGDHLPSFPAAFAALGFTGRQTDYLIWRSDGGSGRRRDLAAHELHGAILAAIAQPQPALLATGRRRAAS